MTSCTRSVANRPVVRFKVKIEDALPSSAPGDAARGEPRPLVVALHPGGNRVAFYGSRFMQQVVIPGLSDLGAVIVAPDCPAASWTDPAAEGARVQAWVLGGSLEENPRQATAKP